MEISHIYTYTYIPSINETHAHTLITEIQELHLAYSSLTKFSKQLLHRWRRDLPDTESTTEFESSTSSSSFSLKKGIIYE